MSRTTSEASNATQSVDLEAEIRRMAEFVTQVARQMGLEGIAGAIKIVTDGTPQASDRVHEMARQFQERTVQMEDEVARFRAVAGGRRGA